jgi:hypothetical protein
LDLAGNCEARIFASRAVNKLNQWSDRSEQAQMAEVVVPTRHCHAGNESVAGSAASAVKGVLAASS